MELKKVSIFKTASIIAVIFIASCNQKQSSTGEINTEKSAVSEESQQKTILFFGDSLTAGYGLDDVSEAFPGVIQHIIDSVKLPYKVVNAGLSGVTTAGGLGRIAWVLKQ